MRIIKDLANSTSCLIITNKAGGGHIEAGKKIQNIIDKKNKTLPSDQKIQVKSVEILTNTFGNCLGKSMCNLWNDNQKKENIKLINFFLKIQKILNVVAAIPVFFSTLRLLWGKNITAIYNVQSIATSAIASAIRVMNFVNKHFFGNNTPITMYLVLTELPTERTSDFFDSIKVLSSNDRKILKLVTTKPLLKENETEEEFWKKNTGLDMENIIYDELPIRDAFIKQDLEHIQDIRWLQVKVNGKKEKKLINPFNDAKLKLSPDKKLYELELNKDNKVLFLMLGSQASFKATLDYVSQTIEWTNENLDENSQAHYLFVLCGGQASLMKASHDLVQNAKNENKLSPKLTVIPVSFQDDVQIAPILARANGSITRGGGLTAMELEKTATGQIFIHVVDNEAKAKVDPKTGEICNEDSVLKEGMSFHEGGNYLYLKKDKKARLITTNTIKQSLTHLFGPRKMVAA
jgi:hypothetical protein